MGELNTIAKVFISIGLVAAAFLLFIGTYLLNKRTKKPEGCEDLEGSCAGCQLVGCSHRKEEQKGEEN